MKKMYVFTAIKNNRNIQKIIKRAIYINKDTTTYVARFCVDGTVRTLRWLHTRKNGHKCFYFCVVFSNIMFCEANKQLVINLVFSVQYLEDGYFCEICTNYKIYKNLG